MTIMIIAFFVNALQLCVGFPLNYMYEREGKFPEEYYV